MIRLYDAYEEIAPPGKTQEERCYCLFEGEDLKIPEMLLKHPQARALVHLILEGYLAADEGEKDSYWRESTEAMVEWMMKKGIVEAVSHDSR